jgi:arsenate reductase (thioredoxin)
MLLPELNSYLAERQNEAHLISPEHKATLDSIAGKISELIDKDGEASIVFICIHNSRRSHLSEVHARAAIHHHGLADSIRVYSGGTVATALNPRAAAAIERAGYHWTKSEGDNPVYSVKFAENEPPVPVWSKVFDDESNPREGFLAVMTCSEAEQNCPYIREAAARIPLYYRDPSEADGTEKETAVYDERSADICRELLYLFARVKAARR